MTQSAVEVLEEYPLALVQGQRGQWRFAWRLTGTSSTDPSATYANFHDWNLYAQARARESRDADLLLDMTSHLTVTDDTPNDGKYVWLTVPGSATAGLEAGPFNSGNAAWDLFAVLKTDPTDDRLVIQGPVSMDPSVTDMSVVET